MRGFIAALALLAGACASTPSITRYYDGPQPPPHERDVGEDVLVLALSGGGARAAAFHYGILQQLRATNGRDGRPLTDHIAMITSVSGGSVLAAYYGLHGDRGLDGFYGAYLDEDWPIRPIVSPLAWIGAVRGGANSRAQLRAWLARHLYDEATLAQMTNGPRVVINATDLYNYTAFAFTPLYFEGICGNLNEVRVADAVAASMAVPMMFRPVVVENHGAQCGPPPAWVGDALSERSTTENVRATATAFRNYRAGAADRNLPANFQSARQTHLHLVDGGVLDNFGLMSLMVTRAAGPPPAPLTPREAVQARRLLILVSNAEYVRHRSYQRQGSDTIGIFEGMVGPLDAATEAGKRESLDAFRGELPAFAEEVRRFRCGLSERDRRALGAGDNWDCNDFSIELDVISFRDLEAREYEAIYDLETDVSLPCEDVQRLVAAGRRVIAANAMLSNYAGPNPPQPLGPQNCPIREASRPSPSSQR